MTIIYKTEDVLIYWDRTIKEIIYEKPGEDYISEVMMTRRGFHDLSAEETRAIYDFIDKLIEG